MDNNKAYTKAIWYLVFATITIMLINVFSMARYSSDIESDMSISIAKPIIVIDSPTTVLTDLDSNIQEISFSVKNFNVEQRSDISFNYQIKFNNTENLPIEYTLYKIDGEDRVLCELSENDISESIYIGHSENTIDNYVLCMQMNDVTYQGQTTEMVIRVEANQVL